MLTIPCPQCSARLKVPPNAAGKRIRCFSCGSIFRPSTATSASSVSPKTQRRSSLLLLLVILPLGAIAAGALICLWAFMFAHFLSPVGRSGDKAEAEKRTPVTTETATAAEHPETKESIGASAVSESTPAQQATTLPASPEKSQQSTSPTTPSSHEDMPRDNRTEITIAEGVGVDAESARRDACRNAVRQVVGAYVDSETVVANDELITDRVVVLSPAFVEKVEPIVGSERSEDGLLRVRVRAHVKLTKLLNELAAGKVRTKAIARKIDTESLVAELTTKSDHHEARGAVLGKLFSDYPVSCLLVTQAEKESIEKSPDGRTYLRVPLSITPNEKAYNAFSTVLCESLSSTERVSGEFQVDGDRLSTDPAATSKEQNRFRDEAVGALVREVFYGGPFAKAISESIDGRGRSPLVDVGPIYIFEDGAIENAYDRTFDMWGRLRGAADSDRYVACMTSAQKYFRRTSWRWFRVTGEEYEAWFAKVPSHALSRTQLLAGDGAVIADDTTTLRNLGVCGGLRGYGLWCVPGFLQCNMDWYTPELRFVRLIEIDDEDVPRISAIKVTLEQGAAQRTGR
jgi:hypothetical protein